MNVSKSQTNPPASQMTPYNRFWILETSEDSMDTTETVNSPHTQRIPPLPPIFIDDVDIQTTTKTIEKDISKEEYNLKNSNNCVKILLTNPDVYKELT